MKDGEQLWSEDLSAGDKRYVIIASRFNHAIVEQMKVGALAALQKYGAQTPQQFWVPGAFELPLAARALADSGTVDAIIALGCVIRGDTPHFDYVSRACVDGLSRVALDTGIPVSLGVLTTETLAQALERASMNKGNKGFDAALTAIEMLRLLDLVRAL